MILQARRTDDPMLAHERDCFLRAAGLDPESVEWRNVVDGVPTPAEVLGFDAMMIGGSGHFSVAHPDEAFFEPLAELLRAVVDARFPTFGSCFGFQLLVDALGGAVGSDEDNSEVGTFSVELTAAGAADELFASLPAQFDAQLGHLDRATRLPPMVVNLARSKRCPFQALRVTGAPIWATQFHPELDAAANLYRYRAYISRYRPDDAGDGIPSRPSPEADALLPRFLGLVAARR